MLEPISIIWFRRNLRCADNAAVLSAAVSGQPILPLFVWDPESEGKAGSATRWWLRRSLRRLDAELNGLGSRLIMAKDDPVAAFDRLRKQYAIRRVLTSRHYDPSELDTEKRVRTLLQGEGVELEIFRSETLFAPEVTLTRRGDPYRVFTPFWKRCLENGPLGPPLGTPRELQKPKRWPESFDTNGLDKADPTSGDQDWSRYWTPGAAGALAQLDRWLDTESESYQTHRDRPDIGGTSQLSAHLHFGEISARQVWHAAWSRAARARNAATEDGAEASAEAFLRQLVWREFAIHLLYHFPHTVDRPLRPEFSRFPWRHSGGDLDAWKEGRTGIPMVDAGMRQLRETGWMHNRVRMVVASFLVKHLLIDWREGARWFDERLVDADLANNTMGWQWVAGSGADAAPYFRVFNPILQGQKFDPNGDYVRRWVPELEGLPAKWIHKPWLAPGSALSDAGIELGDSYPHPIVDLNKGRQRALAAYASLREKKVVNS